MNHRAIWLTAAVLAAIVLLAQIAGAATREETASVATNATVSAEITRNVATVSLHEQASSVAREKVDKDATSDRERAETGLIAGDTIHSMNGASVTCIDDLRTALGQLKPRSAVVLQIERNGQLSFLGFELD